MDGAIETTKDSLGDRMKAYEAVETDRAFDPAFPLIARLDGRAFSTFTRGMEKPFDAALSNIMREVTAHLIEKNHARIGYTQSDEITLIFHRDSEETQPIFGGRAFKIASVLASMAASAFAVRAVKHWQDRVERNPPSFDCRVFTVPDRTEAANCLIWRENDASRNAIQMVAQAHFSPKQLHGKSCDELEDMLAGIDIAMEQFPAWARYGTYLQRRTMEVTLSDEELARIPEKHRPDGPVMRSRVLEMDFAPLRAQSDRVSLVFA